MSGADAGDRMARFTKRRRVRGGIVCCLSDRGLRMSLGKSEKGMTP